MTSFPVRALTKRASAIGGFLVELKALKESNSSTVRELINWIQSYLKYVNLVSLELQIL